ncbi:MAG: hypothetical protein AAGI49_18005 [Bacteroidota bacterium]
MKRSLYIILVLALFGSTLAAQDLKLGKFPIKTFYANFGWDEDLLSNMSSDYFQDMARTPNARLEAMNIHNVEVYSMICENPNIEIGVTLELPRNLELSLGAAAMFNRVDGITYDWRSVQNWDANYMNYSSYADEYALDVALNKRIAVALWRNKLGNAPINLYIGAGTNAGFITNNRMYAYGSSSYTVVDFSYDNSDQLVENVIGNESYDHFNDEVELRNGFTQRIYGQGAVGITFLRRLELGLEGKYGYGYRVIGGAGAKTTNLRSIGLFARWLMF